MGHRHYVIRGGVEGRERLRILARVMRPYTLGLLQQQGIAEGSHCLDLGCGGGDVAFELARLVGVNGFVEALDIDEAKLVLARAEAEERGIRQVHFRQIDANQSLGEARFDLAYLRFVLTHLADPGECLRRVLTSLRPGGLLLVEDIDFAGSFCYPENWAYRRYLELYSETVRRRGGDAQIGPKLPELLWEAGFLGVGLQVVQPAGLEAETKLISPITLENIAEAVLDEELADIEELERLVSALYEFSRNPRTLCSLPRIMQVWGRRPDLGPM